MEISFNQIFDGVTLALHEAFPAAQIHGDIVRQGLKPGDFNVQLVSASEAGQFGSRAERNITFDVIFFPPENDGLETCMDVIHRLPSVLSTITTPNGDKVHCLKLDGSMKEDVLHCIVSYPHFVYSPADGDAMESVTTVQEV